MGDPDLVEALVLRCRVKVDSRYPAEDPQQWAQLCPQQADAEPHEGTTALCYVVTWCDVLGEAELHEYADPLSSINVNYFLEGQELGWHFDNSSFADTLLVQESEAGGRLGYHDAMRCAALDRHNEQGVAAVLDGQHGCPSEVLAQRAGDLALFRGRDALHRVTPVQGDRQRILVVLAYNADPGRSLSEHARLTFFGRLG